MKLLFNQSTLQRGYINSINSMKQYIVYLILIFFFSPGLSAQTVFYDAAAFPLLGKISTETETRYERLPASLNGKTRAPVWHLGKNTSGLAVRFRTNSTAISARWDLLEDVKMNHMTEVGIKGLDLYVWENDHWQFVNSGRPSGKSNEKNIIANMMPKQREYLLFLPLYDGLVKLELGIDSASTILQPAWAFPQKNNPIVVYGTSITQGGCATRPGMSYTNILMRNFNREVINLGFSGNGQLDYEIAEVMAKRKDAALFILDFIPNVNAQQIKDKTEKFVNIIRKDNNSTPILFIETVIFPHSLYDKNMYAVLVEKNKLLRKEYEKMKNRGDKNVFYLSGKDLIGNDGEATVDGIHFTDVGFMRFADGISPIIKNILKSR